MLEIKQSSVHGTGAFATCSIRSGTLLGYYTGKVYPSIGTCPRYTPGEVTYFWALSNGKVIDGRSKLRYVNHSCDPNVSVFEVVDKGRLKVAFKARRNIAKGSELFIRYNLIKAKDDDLIYDCFCRSSQCTGTMLDQSLL